MITPAQAKAMFANIEKESPERWSAAVQTLIVATMESLEATNAKLDKLARGAYALAAEVKRLRSGAPPPEAATSTPDTSTVAGTGVTESAVGADGQPRTPEEIALEKQMDEAIAAGEEAKTRANPAASAPRRAEGRKRLAPVPAPKTEAEQQAAAEAQMDAAIAATEAEKGR